MEPKRPPRLCYKCGDKYYPGHHCGRQLLLLEGGEVEEDAREEILVIGEEGEEEDNVTISLHAIKGVTSSKIIKMEGKVLEGSLMVLIDSGSSHSFIDEGTRRKMKCELPNTQPLAVTVANRSRVLSKSTHLGFCWTMQRESFKADLRLLKLGGCQIVLRVDWMREVCPISFNCDKMEVSLARGGRRITLQGNVETGGCKLIRGKRLHKLLKCKISQVTQLFTIEAYNE